jgi:hypothetical protein
MPWWGYADNTVQLVAIIAAWWQGCGVEGGVVGAAQPCNLLLGSFSAL